MRTTPTYQTSTFSALFLSLLLCVVDTTQAQNFSNLNFEKVLDENQETADWILGNGATIENSGSDQGNVLKLNSEPNGRKEFFQDSKIDNHNLAYYRLTARVKVDTAQQGRVYLWADIFGTDSLVLNYASQRVGSIADNGWNIDTLEFFVPSNSEIIRIGGSIRGENTAWFDDFFLEKITLDTTIELSQPVQAYIDSALYLIQNKALHRDILNFKEIRQITHYYANGAESIKGTHPALFNTMRLLADNHSQFGPADQVKRAFNLDTLDIEKMKRDIFVEPGEGVIDSLSKTINYGKSELLNSQIGYISIPSFTSLYKDLHVLFADTIQNRIAKLDKNELKGWIIDLRENGGGATPPMILGIGPLLDGGNKMLYVDASLETSSTSRYENGNFYAGDYETDSAMFTSTINYNLKKKDLPVAILINSNSASAAEGVAAIFHGQSNVKLFGTKSAGLTTGNGTYFLNDGSLILLTESYLANRNKKVFKNGIEPDVKVNYDGKIGEEMGTDLVIKKAVGWIEKGYGR